jgi:RNA polymerase sigma-70 factor (ECF subfamily)
MGQVENMQKDAQTAEQNDGAAHRIRNVVAAGAIGAVPRTDSDSLAGRLRHGDRTAAEELVDQYYERIYLFMRAVGHDRQISEDLTQETFLRAWYHIGQLRDGKALNGWLFRIAGNVSRLYWRKRKDVSATSMDGLELPLAGPNGLEGASGQEDMVRLRKAVARLPRKLRQAVVLHYVEQLTISEAAEAAGVRQGTLKSRLNRALEALRKQMREQ